MNIGLIEGRQAPAKSVTLGTLDESVWSAEEAPAEGTMEIVFRHMDDYTVARIGLDDFPYFEIPDERYGEKGAS